MSTAYTVKPEVSAQMEAWGFALVSLGVWRTEVDNVMVFASIYPDDKQVTGHLTRKLAQSKADYSQVWAVPYTSDPSAALAACAMHMLSIVEEHSLSGGVVFSPFGAAREDRIILSQPD